MDRGQDKSSREAIRKVIDRAAGQIDRLQVANERQRHVIDSMLQFMRDRDLVQEYNQWAGRSRPNINREIRDVQLPDEPEPPAASTSSGS